MRRESWITTVVLALAATTADAQQIPTPIVLYAMHLALLVLLITLAVGKRLRSGRGQW
jgi:cytochrome c biogenesis protein CcdA